jgi:hypothetical protein
MDEMQILVPVTVKSKLTEKLKKTLMDEIDQNLSRVDHDLAQLEFEANGKLAEQAKINVQGVASLRAQFEQQKLRMTKVKNKLTADKEHLEKLTIGAEITRPTMSRVVTLHIGDDMNQIMAGEILVEDGKIVAFRN